MSKAITRLNPAGMLKSPAFSQAIKVKGNGSTIYVGGQNAVNEKNEVIGKGDVKKQTEQVLKNITVALKAGGADWENVIKLSIYIVQGQNAKDMYEYYQKFLGENPNPPIVTVVFVAALGNPDILLEIDAVAFVEE